MGRALVTHYGGAIDTDETLQFSKRLIRDENRNIGKMTNSYSVFNTNFGFGDISDITNTPMLLCKYSITGRYSTPNATASQELTILITDDYDGSATDGVSLYSITLAHSVSNRSFTGSLTWLLNMDCVSSDTSVWFSMTGNRFRGHQMCVYGACALGRVTMNITSSHLQVYGIKMN